MNNCLIVVIMTMQIFLGNGQASTVTVTACVDYQMATTTPRQELPGGALAIGRDYESMADLSLPDSSDILLRPGPDVGLGEMGVIYE